jgi:ubiquinone biosynthesis protein
VRQLRRSREIGTTFARHGFGFVWEQFAPALRARLGQPRKAPAPVPAERLAEHFRLALEELGPTFVKFGQVISTRPDLLPPAYIAELTRLQDAVPPAAWEEVRATLIQELGRPPEEVFASIDPVPLAAASLAQVHVATLPDGTQVVVKVQRANITQTIETDLAILAELAAGAQHTPLGRLYDLPAIVDDFATTLRSELDYRREGRNADRFRENFKDVPYVYIPRVYWNYTTGRVLVLERIAGIKIDDIAGMDATGVDRQAVALHSARLIIKEVLEDGFFHADPHPGNFVVMPGNVVGAMDFGMVGYLDDALRLDLVRLYAASVEMDEAGVVEQLIRMGAVAEDVDRRGLALDIGRLLHKYRGMVLKEVRATEMVADIMPIAFRHRLRLPSDLWLLGKTLSMMEGLGLRLDPNLDIFAVSRPAVRQLLLRLLLPSSAWSRELMLMGLDWAEAARLLPKAGAKMLHLAEQGDFFSLRIKGLEDLLYLLDRLATRLAISVLVAALTIGMALLMPNTAGHLVARIVTGAGFFVSALLGLWLIYSMLRPPRRPR